MSNPHAGLEELESGPAGEVWRGKRGELRVVWTRSDLAVAIVGHGDARYAEVLVRCLEEIVARAPRPIGVYVDLERMPTYDSALRTDLTIWFASHRAQVRVIHVFTTWRIVLMGVAVANLALAGLVEVHETRGGFDHALRQTSISDRFRSRPVAHA